jgi:hypothetical protein
VQHGYAIAKKLMCGQSVEHGPLPITVIFFIHYIDLFAHVIGDSFLTRRVLPETSILSNMTGHAMWQTFSNLSADADKMAAMATEAEQRKDSQDKMEEVG